MRSRSFDEEPGADPARMSPWYPFRGWAEAGPSAPTHGLPPVFTYDCFRTADPIVVDGRLDEPVWSRATWSAPFVDITTADAATVETRLALVWDATHLYAGYRLVDPDPRAVVTLHHEHHYWKDNDAELFIEGRGRYYEMGVNSINTIYEVRWAWLEPIIASSDFTALDELLRIRDRLYYLPRDGERLGRIGDIDFDLPGLRHAVARTDDGWTVEFAVPWKGLRMALKDPELPPSPAETMRMQAYRGQHDRSDPARNAEFEAQVGPGASPLNASTWSAMGNPQIHNPERWVTVRFVDDLA